MIDTWTATQPMAGARLCLHAGTDHAAPSANLVDARLRGIGLPSAVRNGFTVAVADKGTIPSSCAWSPPV